MDATEQVNGVESLDVKKGSLESNLSLLTPAPVKFEGDNKIWCEECNIAYDEFCYIHGRPYHIKDSCVPTRAILSTPSILSVVIIERTEILDAPVYGVFTKKAIQTNTQFGPYEGKLQEEWTYDRYDRLKLKIFRKGASSLFYNCTDQHSCNWMMFVRPTTVKEEQNLVAYQYCGGIYYTVTKLLPINTELRVWYSKPYGEQIEQSLLEQNKLDTGDIKLEVNSDNTRITSNTEYGSGFGISESYSLCHDLNEVYKDIAHNDNNTTGTFKEEKPFVNSASNSKLMAFKKTIQNTKGQKARKHKARIPGCNKNHIDQTKTPVFECSECRQIFRSRNKLDIHFYQHSGEMRFKCDVLGCTKGFNARSKLLRHQLVHNNKRQFACDYCDKTFLRKDHLKTHLKTHGLNQEKHQCNKCGKEYTCAFSFKVHLGIHAAEKGETKCFLCQEECGTSKALEQHIKLHSRARTTKRNVKQKKHMCIVCNLQFYTILELKRHMLVHTKEKQFLCQYCPKQFGRKDHLMKHMKSHDRTALHQQQNLKAPSKYTSKKNTVSMATNVASPIILNQPSTYVSQYQPESAGSLANFQNSTTVSPHLHHSSYADHIIKTHDVLHQIPQSQVTTISYPVTNDLETGHASFQIVWQAPSNSWSTHENPTNSSKS